MYVLKLPLQTVVSSKKEATIFGVCRHAAHYLHLRSFKN
jgi:hypothetical protein